MSLPKFRRLYFPGLISLVLLPMMWICYLISSNTFHKYQAMTFVWVSKAQLNIWIGDHDKKLNADNCRKYTVLNLTGNSREDDKSTAKLRALLNMLFTKNDTINGIKVILGNHATYNQLVEVYDAGLQYKDQGLWLAPTEKEIFFGHVAPRPIALSASGRYLYNDIVSFRPKNNMSDQSPLSIEKIVTVLSEACTAAIKFWPSTLAFIMMLWFAFNKSERYLDVRSFGPNNN